MTFHIKHSFVFEDKILVGINTISNKDNTKAEYPNISKNIAEKAIANKQAKKRSEAILKDCFREGWIHKIANIPAVATFVTPKDWATAIDKGVATAVLRVL